MKTWWFGEDKAHLYIGVNIHDSFSKLDNINYKNITPNTLTLNILTRPL